MTITPYKDGHILLVPPSLGDGNFAMIKGLPGHFRWLDRTAIVRVTGANLLYILAHWPDASWIGGAEDVLAAHQEQSRLAASVSEAKADPNALVDDSGYTYRRAPMAHQRKAFALSRDAPAFGLFMEQGTGKTKVIIDTACYLYERKLIECLIIVAWPNGVHENWIEYELPEDMTVPYAAEAWTSNHAAKHRRVAYTKLMLAKDKLRVMTFNIEAFTSPAGCELLERFLTEFKCLFVIDQSASIKNPAAKRTKFLVNHMSRLAPFRRVLDGAPVAEGAEELYSQFKFLDPMIIGHDTWTGFRAEFCEIGFFNEIKGYKNIGELRRRIDGFSFRVLADDCLDLPERVYMKWAFDLSANEQRIFDELKVKDLAYFKDQYPEEEELLDTIDHIEEHSALVKNLRLQQISAGWWPGDPFKGIEEDEPSRLTALKTLLLEAKGKALIFARFRADLQLMQNELGTAAVSYHGGISREGKLQAKRDFMNPKSQVKYFLGQPRTAGIGHTLTAAEHVIFYNNDPSLRLREECEKRAHRQGLKHRLMVWDLVARGSHDGAIVKSLRAKKDLANVIMQDPQTFFLQHDT